MKFLTLSLLTLCLSLNVQASNYLKDQRRESVRVPNDISDAVVTKVRMTKLTTEESADYSGCDNSTREPGGSMYCPAVTSKVSKKFLEVSFSYNSKSGADEYGNTFQNDYFVFDLDKMPKGSVAQFSAALKSKSAARSLGIKISQAYELTKVVDEANSVFCATTLNDGSFSKVDSNCQDQVKYTQVLRPYTVATIVNK